MKAIEDAKWRDAAALLGLVLVRRDGRAVPAKKGARHHRMQRTIEGHRVMFVETPDNYAKLVRVAVRAAMLAESARSALMPAE